MRSENDTGREKATVRWRGNIYIERHEGSVRKRGKESVRDRARERNWREIHGKRDI